MEEVQRTHTTSRTTRLPESEPLFGKATAKYVWDLVPITDILLRDWRKIPTQTSLLAQLFKADISRQREHHVLSRVLLTQGPLQTPVPQTFNNT